MENNLICTLINMHKTKFYQDGSLNKGSFSIKLLYLTSQSTALAYAYALKIIMRSMIKNASKWQCV